MKLYFVFFFTYRNHQTYCVNNNLNNNNHNQNTQNNNNNNNSNHLPIREEIKHNYDEVIIEKKVVKSSTSEKISATTTVNHSSSTNKNNHRVKFIDEENTNMNTTINQNLASSQPLMNGHLVGNQNENLTESQKMANSHPHVTIASHPEIPKEDRAFRTKIDK